jgi:chromosome segregation ATPase
MKRLTRIQAAGLKSLHSIDLEVPPLLAIAGDNGTGKSALRQAVVLAMLGHDPAIGKTLSAARKLAGSGSPIEVGIVFDDAFGIHRSIGRSQEIDVSPPKGETTQAEMESRIADETGAHPLSFDLAGYLALSAEKRKEALFAWLPRGDVLTEDLFREWLGYEGAADNMRHAIDRLWTEHVMEAASPVDGLAAAIEFARTQGNKAEQDRLAQTKVLEAAERDAATATEAIDYDPARAATLQAELAAVQEDLGRARERQAGEEERATRARAHQHQLQVHEIQLRDAEARLAAAQRAAEAAPDLLAPEGLSALDQLLAKAERRLDAHADAMAFVTERRAAAGAQLKSVAARYRAIQTAAECPTCGSAASVVEARARLEREGRQLRENLATAEAAFTAAQTEHADLDGDVRLRRGALDEHRREAEIAREARRNLGQAEGDLGRVQAELEQLRAQDFGEILATPYLVLGELEARADDLRHAIAVEQLLAKRAGAAEAERTRATRERQTLEVLTVRRDALKKLQSGLAPVEATADQVLRSIDPSMSFRLIFEREDRDTFDLGFERDGAFRSLDAASTGEAAFLGVAFVAAMLAATAPAWPVLLLDNAESIDDRRRKALMRALAGLQDRIGNVILSGCCSFPKVAGWQVVQADQLTGAAAAAAA